MQHSYLSRCSNKRGLTMRRNPVPVLLMFHYNFHYLLTSSIWNVTWVVNKKWHLSSKFHITIDFNQGYREVKIKGYNSVHHFCLTHAEPCITSPKLQSLDFFLLISLNPCGRLTALNIHCFFLFFKALSWKIDANLCSFLCLFPLQSCRLT